jgi:transaldolase
MNPLKQLIDFGQSVWLDNIHRGMLTSGELKRLIDVDGVRGLTSNPTIFEKALAGAAYDEDIRRFARSGKTAAEVFDLLSISDIQAAADLFRPLYDATGGADGFVSLEVSPIHARDTAATVREARRLWAALGRPNAMIKIPATREGLPAIADALADGINVNVTLIFSLERYREVIAAYRAGLERRAAAGRTLDVSSVASFFVSRIDSTVDKELTQRGSDAAHALRGRVAVANARAAYALFQQAFAEPWFQALRAKGARVQRPLWASTGTKNPAYSDVLYVDSLVGPDTVNTVPPATLDAYRDHGRPSAALRDGDDGSSVLQSYRALGGDLVGVTDALEIDGVKQFADSFEKLLAGLAAKMKTLEK